MYNRYDIMKQKLFLENQNTFQSDSDWKYISLFVQGSYGAVSY